MLQGAGPCFALLFGRAQVLPEHVSVMAVSEGQGCKMPCTAVHAGSAEASGPAMAFVMAASAMSVYLIAVSGAVFSFREALKML